MATDTATPAINLLDPAFYVDPWAAYRWLRDEAPVVLGPRPGALGHLPLRRHRRLREGRRHLLVAPGLPTQDRPELGPVDDQPRRARPPGPAQPRLPEVHATGGARPRGPRPPGRDRDPRCRHSPGRVRGGRSHRLPPPGDDDHRAAGLPAGAVGEAPVLVRERHVRRWSDQPGRKPARLPAREHAGGGGLLGDHCAGRAGPEGRPPRRPDLHLGPAGMGRGQDQLGDPPRGRRRRRDHPDGDRIDDP